MSKPNKRWFIFLFVVLISSGFVILMQGQGGKTAGINKVTGAPRIVSLTPNVTQILTRLGIDEELVGISDFCKLPSSYKERPHCGGLINPNYERILSLKPTHIFLLGRMEHVHRFATKHGFIAESINIDSFDDLCRETEKIGALLNRPESTAALLKNLKDKMHSVKANRKTLKPLRCLIVLDREKSSLRRMMAIGSTSYLSEMLNAAGGENIYSSQKQGYFYVSIESILALQPEVIFDLVPGLPLNDDIRTTMLNEWGKEPSIPAVKNHRIMISNEEMFSIPGPDMPLVAERFQGYLQSLVPAQ